MSNIKKLEHLLKKENFDKLSPANKTAIQNYQSAVIGKQNLTKNAIALIDKLYSEVGNG